MSSVSIKSAKDRYGGTTEAETIANLARAHQAYRVYKYANDYGDRVTHTDYKLVASDADEAALRSSNLVHNVVLVYDRGKALNVDATPSPPSQQIPKSHDLGQNLAESGTKTDWYIATSDAKHARQIVVDIPATSETPPQVSALVPPGESFAFMTQPWAAITLFMSVLSPSPGPFVFIRAEGYIDQFRHCPLRVAFCFYRMNAGGLLTVFVHVLCPSVEARTGNPAVLENHQNLDGEESPKLVSALIGRDQVEVCFTASGAAGPCTGYFGMAALLPVECRDALRAEWNQLLQYHQGVSAGRRSFAERVRQYEQENPMEANPILRRPTTAPLHAETATASPARRPTTAPLRAETAKARPARPWWQFWK